MINEKSKQFSSVFNSHQSRVIAIIVTFFTTLFTISVFLYLSITPSTEFEDDFGVNLQDNHQGVISKIWDLKATGSGSSIGEWKSWIGLSDGRDRQKESDKIRELINVFQDRFPKDDGKAARDLNKPSLERLADCIASNTCGEGEETVVILASMHFNNAVMGKTSGEDIWARSSLEALHSLNYTLLYTFAPMDTLTLYQGLSDRVKTIIWESIELKKCMKRNETNWESLEDGHSPGKWQNTTTGRFGCVRRTGYEEGIPLEKSFTFHFWSGAENPLGAHFTLSPENYAMWNHGIGNHYLGYSIESRCKAITLPSSKEHKGMALGKYSKYFNTSSTEWVWGKDDILNQVVNTMPESDEKEKFELIATIGHYEKSEVTEDHVRFHEMNNLGPLPQDEWYQTLASSKFLVGVGKPKISPSPYDALCFGVPFINPVLSWNRTDPDDWTKWYSQHDGLRPYGPPFVYHVQKNNKEQLEEAMRLAIENPIDSFIPPPMTRTAVRDRHRALVETDWKPWAIAAVKELWTDKGKEFPYLVEGRQHL
ncbi:uncharacterized protein IL334_002625 [Kwoniella shivajii]|uniref:alpha-1,6-mannosyl-glycoprotein 6-beta-N-acetylglucosaminyltransferase n=1 Tax=Kwoniella shivajii TaxID=564305 RepID=A0ABZ1CV86_9TREE|nr:hypothetical protein IL334_002625 [Kwoniella shivajii]